MTSFDSYNNEYLSLQQSINAKLDQELPKLRGEERKSGVRRTYRDLDEADEIIEQMQLTAKSNPKQSILVRSAKAQLKSWRSKLQHLETISDRDLLLSTRPTHSAYDIGGSDDEENDEVGSTGQQQRQRLLNSTQTLNTSSNRLDNAQRLAAENEEIGQGVLNSLIGQRIQLQGANESLEEADVSVNRASRTITKMIRTAYRQRITIGIFIVVLVTLIGLILWRKLT
ncbi:v-SNARE domain-containing protein [Sporobolomyces salmoneus]|uniref:v-SNARE domain-containing protein n=1 Tax=Sporobolomyces salmoneus TaxID=183962 RepID=UPI003181BBFC